MQSETSKQKDRDYGISVAWVMWHRDRVPPVHRLAILATQSAAAALAADATYRAALRAQQER